MPNRTNTPIIVFTLAFTSCIAYAYAWFNADLGRSASDVSRPWSSVFSLRSSVSGPQQRIWLQAKTNIPGYTFIPEPVSDEVKKILRTTNILNEAFYEAGRLTHRTTSFRL